ncbi:hypothetical protein CgunFtcFv8_015687 [Champsocephalus gunnari]|uniref:Uncharacterized protein n=1 Tax=Champsocephalus gunnari TaxID=52237 RepID=A0AAN8H1B8_CHAGU|nr:hypothetical protein CgunFtcFv8_015687 [Champsocephalus gunnari]
MAYRPLLINHPPGSILRDEPSSRAEQNVNTKVMLSPRTSAVIEAASSTNGMCIESDKPASYFSLCCVAFSTHHRVPTGDWLAETNHFKDSPTDQYLSSSALPELPIYVTGGPHSSRWDKCQDMAGCLRPAYRSDTSS